MSPPSTPHAVDTIPALLERAATPSPDRIALAAPGHDALGYRALVSHVEAAGRQLRAMGIGRNDRVALVMRNGPAMASAFLAVACTAACAPLNPRLRADELEFSLSDLAARAVIVEAGIDSAARSVARSRGLDVIELAVEPDHGAGLFTLQGPIRHAGHERPARADDIALLLHTSGTTSRPKLVPLRHRNLTASALAVGSTLALDADDRCLGVMPLFHIHGLVASLLAPLAAGSSVVCAADFSAASFFACLDAYRPTWYTAVPTMHQAILAHAPEAGEIAARSRLRFVRSSSAPLTATVMAGLESLFRAPVIEAYGMTEAAHQVASNPLPPGKRKAGSVGRAAGAEAAIVDDAGLPLAPGQRGEVAIRGPSLMAGYANAAAPLSDRVADGWFRTGDEGYLDADGYLYLTGRLKEIINRGGEKISPREIDDALAAHPAVAQAIAFAVPHEALGEDVAAAVVLRSGAAATERQLRDWLFERLADFKVPSRIVLVDAIPMGSTGKLARIGLSAKLADRLASKPVAPRDPLEIVVANIFRDVLVRDEVGVDDNFFALGGDSLRGADASMRIRSIFGVDLGGAAVFRYPTVAELADEIRSRRGPANAPAAPPGRTDEAPQA
jgi:acyl-CoA synthetase (AMP-forming)/AMP-acid ligase II/acyl carrier protein